MFYFGSFSFPRTGGPEEGPKLFFDRSTPSQRSAIQSGRALIRSR